MKDDMKKITKKEFTRAILFQNFIERYARECNLSEEQKIKLQKIAAEELAQNVKF